MNRALQHARYWLRHLGWPIGLAVALLVGAATFYGTVTAPMQDRILQLQAQRAEQQRHIVKARREQAKPVLTPEQRLDRFYRSFPDKYLATVWLDKIYQVADKQKLSLAKGEYKILPEQSGQLLRYEISLPVSGPYIQLRAFMLGVLQDIPSASLQDVRLKRESIAKDNVDATIRFIVYLRKV
jgi:hypothetical protein